MVVTAGQPNRAPDKDGWYNHAVEIGFDGTDALSGVAACTTTTYRGPDGSAQPVPGTCTDRAGNVGNAEPVVLRYDGTAPLVTGGSPARTPDANGWYNHPVAIAFTGTDGTSGLAGCSTSTYEGPDSAAASLLGTCTDIAGNTSAPVGHPLQYDATPPEITRAVPERGPDANGWYNRPVSFVIEGKDATSGIQACPGTTYSGPNGAASSFLGQCSDRAGNLASRAFGLKFDTALLSPATTQAPLRRRLRLIAPAAGAVIKAGRRPLLRWTPVPGASYYNVQLFRKGKILSAWTSRPRYRLGLRWRHGGRRYRLIPGDYQWIVWPGFGPRSKADYGRRIGRRTFEVARAARWAGPGAPAGRRVASRDAPASRGYASTGGGQRAEHT